MNFKPLYGFYLFRYWQESNKAKAQFDSLFNLTLRRIWIIPVRISFPNSPVAAVDQQF